MSDQHIGAFIRFVRQDPLAAARALKAALTDDQYCALFEALTTVEGWSVSSVETETDDSGDESEMRYQRKTVTYDRWLPKPEQAAEQPDTSMCTMCDGIGSVTLGAGWDPAPCMNCEGAGKVVAT